VSKKKPHPGLERIAERRRQVEERLSSLRGALADETGHAPRSRGLTMLLFAATVGLALALRGKARKEGRLPAAGKKGAGGLEEEWDRLP
jgi:hypothetical protein